MRRMFRFVMCACVIQPMVGTSIGQAAADQAVASPPVPVGGVSAPVGPVPRLPDGKPDLSGVWFGGGPVGNIEDGLAAGESIPLLPEARKLKASRFAKDEPLANCLPAGVPRVPPLPWRIIQTATHIFFLYEGNYFRQIFMDGRPHPTGEALNPTWYGHSIGRWEGDALVIDSVGFNDRSWFDYVGHPHTERLHVVERITRRDRGTLLNEITIDDPGAYARPFSVTFRAQLAAGVELMEYICNENNTPPGRMQGPAEAIERSRTVPNFGAGAR